MEINLQAILDTAIIRKTQIHDDALEFDVINDEYMELANLIATTRNLMKIQVAKESGGTYKLFKISCK